MISTPPDPEWKKGSAELLVLSLLEDRVNPALARRTLACRFNYSIVNYINGAGGGNRTHGLGIMRPSLYH